MSKPGFTIVTPSFNALPYLKLCCASITDQKGIEVEHIVVDGGSTDGTVEWLKTQSRPSFRWISEKDTGMYNAINKGFRLAQGELIAHLNCDEQYLPGTLATVAQQFKEKEDDILLGDAIVIDTEGRYLCSRRVLPPLYYHTLTCHLSTFTAATFFRRHILDRYDAYFDEIWKCSGDATWMLNLLRRQVRMSALGQYTSVFMDRGADNLALSALAKQDTLRRASTTPTWIRTLAPLWSLDHRLRRLLHGIYFVKPFQYAIYAPDSMRERTLFTVNRPGFLWKSRLAGQRKT